MNASQASQASAKFGSKFILSDTMGPRASGEHPRNNLAESTDSNQGDLTTANQTPGTSVATEDVHVLGFRGDEIRGGAPDSTASSSNRFFLGASGKPREYSVGNFPASGSTNGSTVKSVGSSGQTYDYAYSGPGYRQPSTSTGASGQSHDYVNAAFTGNTDETNGPNQIGRSMRAEIAKHRSSAKETITPIDDPHNEQPNGRIGNDHGEDTKLTDEEEKTGNCLPKVGIVGLIAVTMVVGIVILVFLAKENEPDKLRGSITDDEKAEPKTEECPEVSVLLQETIAFKCKLTSHVYPSPARLRVTPPAYVNNGKSFLLEFASKDAHLGWNASYSNAQLAMSGPEATCSSDGVYGLEFLQANNFSLYNSSVKISVKSQVLKVNVTLEQPVNETESTDFKIGCSTSSGCEQSFVDFFAEINKEEASLRGVNFSCSIDYNDYDGYRVSCVGSIPDYLISQFERITCRPRSTLLDNYTKEELDDLEQVLELPDCDLANHCGYTCATAGDYFVVNSGRCDIFHRCYNKNVYTTYCAPGTFFDPNICACSHKKDLPWCQPNGALKQGVDVADETCEGQE